MRPAARALNEAELSDPLSPAQGRRVLVAETAGKPPTPALPLEFSAIAPLGRWTIPLGARKTRELELYVGAGYRGPVSGLATPP
ncbi:MAG: hypothetical protein WDM92_10490 [Caulobacteraceae bacterium]